MAGRGAVWALVVVLAAVAVAAPRAHELGTTRVRLTFAPDGTLAGEIETDAAALVEKLEALGGAERDGTGDGAEARIRALAPMFWSRVHLAVDGVTSAPPSHAEVSVSPGAAFGEAPVARIRWHGTWTASAQAMTWSYGWTFTPYALAVAAGRQEPVVTWVDGSETSPPIALAVPAAPSGAVDGGSQAGASWAATSWRYLELGFRHILPLGIDHVLFVLGLCLLATRPRALLAQVTAFTLAHSLTLAASMTGLITLPASIVEPLIALSIAYVAVENLFTTTVTSTRVSLVFACGLLHGFGFAGVLHDAGVPAGQFVAALAAFNVGVEVAQLVVVGVALLLLGGPVMAGRHWYRERVVIPVSLAIALVAVYWVIERMHVTSA